MKPLKGLKVLDFTEKLTGNLTTMYLSSYGAEVIKVERPNVGDPVRLWKPIKNGKSVYFEYLNRGKKSLEIDINTENGCSIIKKLVKQCDVVCESFHPEFMDSIGLGYNSLKKINPKIIYASCSYFGNSGPYKNKPGTSTIVQSLGVSMDMTGRLGEYPIKSGPSIVEHYSAGYLATGIMLALINRNITGEGQKVDISLLDSVFSIIEAAPAAYSLIGEIHTRKGNFDPACAPYDTFKTNDGYVAVGVATEGQWSKFCEAINMTNLIEDPRFKYNEGRCDDYTNKLRPILEGCTLKHSKYEIEDECKKRGIPCSAVLDIEEIINHPQIADNNFMFEMESKKIGRIKVPSLPMKLSTESDEHNSSAPELGENTKEILSDLELTIKQLLFAI
ncbi:CaiB/BaiF CoA transferase family protein [Clostridium sp.]